MQAIEIDFEVFKELTIRRENEETTYNDVVRKLLGLEISSSIEEDTGDSGAPFVSKNVVFPHGTKLRAEYKGRHYYAEVNDGSIAYNGQYHTSLSSAGIAVTETNINGWIFWECRRPGEENWTLVDKIRRQGSKLASQI